MTAALPVAEGQTFIITEAIAVRASNDAVRELVLNIIDGLLAELDQEAVATRRVLERIPQEHLSWKPHPKSMSLGQLALHVATVPGDIADLAAVDTIPNPGPFVQAEAGSAAELVPTLIESLAKARRLLDQSVPSVYGPTADESPFAG